MLRWSRSRDDHLRHLGVFLAPYYRPMCGWREPQTRSMERDKPYAVSPCAFPPPLLCEERKQLVGRQRIEHVERGEPALARDADAVAHVEQPARTVRVGVDGD